MDLGVKGPVIGLTKLSFSSCSRFLKSPRSSVTHCLPQVGKGEGAGGRQEGEMGKPVSGGAQTGHLWLHPLIMMNHAK